MKVHMTTCDVLPRCATQRRAAPRGSARVAPRSPAVPKRDEKTTQSFCSEFPQNVKTIRRTLETLENGVPEKTLRKLPERFLVPPSAAPMPCQSRRRYRFLGTTCLTLITRLTQVFFKSGECFGKLW